jgi:hypothetical protein
MPFTAPVTRSPYPSIEEVMNLARVRVNEAMNDIAGDILTDDAPFTGTMLNGAWRWLQDRVYSAGAEKPIMEGFVFGFPSRGSTDVADQAWITWNGCYDGKFEYESPTLPPNLIQPLSVWRREANGTFCLMQMAQDGLPNSLDPNVYDWRSDGMYFHASGNTQDFRFRYYAYLQPLDINFPQRPVEMVGCQDCLAARVAYEYASARGAVGAAQLMQWAETSFEQIAQRTSRRKQRMSARRQPYSSQIGYGAAWPVIGGN